VAEGVLDIVLFGAEISFVRENGDMLQTDDPEYEHISVRVKKLTLLRIAVFCVNRFAQGRAPVTSLSIADHLNLSVNITSVFMEKLVHIRILFKVSDPEPGFTPARDIECLSVMDVVTAFENMGEDDLYLGDTLALSALEQSLESFAAAARQSPGEQFLKDI